jgi:hypothetical protein
MPGESIDTLLMHHRNWFHIPHDARIFEAPPRCLQYTVGVPEKIKVTRSEEDDIPSPLVEFDSEIISLRYYAWWFMGKIRRLFIGYGPQSNTVVWRNADSSGGHRCQTRPWQR